MNAHPDTFTPALGRNWLTPAYDVAIRLLTRENRWRRALVRQIDPPQGGVLLDVGCGTGSLAIMLKRVRPDLHVTGMDPDPQALAIARAKAEAAGVEIEWRKGFARDAADDRSAFDRVVSSLVFHQVPMHEKVAGIEAMVAATRTGGSVHIADYATQRGWLMRRLFGVIQRLDGVENTQANADGAIERHLARFSSDAATPVEVFRTPTGAISLFCLRR